MVSDIKVHSGLFVFFLILYLVIIYSNTFQVPMMLDDRINIVDRQNLHLSTLSIQTITETFFKQGENGKYLYRPISSFSLALNYFIGRFNVAGYHIVNLTIHLFTAIFLFRIIQMLLILKHSNLDKFRIVFVAGLATILWSAHPIQTQAVTYIVQRMASLSTMFYVLGLWSYLYFRIAMGESRSIPFKWLFLSFLFFVCAVLSKENAVLFPLGVFLIELYFFDGYEKIKKKPMKSLAIALALLSIPVAVFLHSTDFEQLVSSYSYRPFTMGQRILTEIRILIFYISQLLYPVPGRFSISHSFLVSDSLFNPLSTLFALTGIIGVLIFAITAGRRYPLLGFSIVFYFLHHLVESTVIPLELVFEHRNYLPSIFFFLPISFGAVNLLNFYKEQNKLLFYLIIIFINLLIFLLGFSTFMRNNDWKSHESLWKSALRTSPNIIRPYAQLGWSHTSSNRTDLEKAYSFFNQGLEKENSYNIFEKAMLWLNISKIYEKTNDTERTINALLNSLQIFEKEIDKNPELVNQKVTIKYLADNHYYLSNNYSHLNEGDKAITHINKALSLQNNPVFLNAKSNFLIKAEKYDQALQILQTSLKLDPDSWNANFLIGKTLTSLKFFPQGFWFYKNALGKIESQKISFPLIYLYLAENRLLAGRDESGDSYISQFVKYYSIEKSVQFIKKYQSQQLDILPLTDSLHIFSRLKMEIRKMTRMDEVLQMTNQQ
jgi:protein O-mannosyl-transferase